MKKDNLDLIKNLAKNPGELEKFLQEILQQDIRNDFGNMPNILQTLTRVIAGVISVTPEASLKEKLGFARDVFHDITSAIEAFYKFQNSIK